MIGWYQQTRHGKAFVPDMIWGTLQTEAYAALILRRVVDFMEVPDDVPAGVAKRMERQQVLTTVSTGTRWSSASRPCTRT